MSLGNLIKFMDENLYRQYIFERYSSGDSKNSSAIKNSSFTFKTIRFDKIEKKIEYENAQRISELSSDHYCVNYVKSRKIPEKFYKEIYFTDNFALFAKELFPEVDKQLFADKRLVLPILDKYNTVVGVFARALVSASSLRYIRLNFNDDKTLFGQYNLDLKVKVKIVEGAIDSMFLRNCVASGDSALNFAAARIESENIILVFDNEPRNVQIVNLIKNSINLGHNVVIWPDKVDEKDINEMIISGRTEDEIENLIQENTFSGLQANLKFNSWRKC